MLKQKTLKDSFSLSGKGLHTGLDLTVTSVSYTHLDVYKRQVLPICTGRKPATWVCGKALHKMH